MLLLFIYAFSILILSCITGVCLELPIGRNGEGGSCRCLKSQSHLNLQGEQTKAY